MPAKLWIVEELGLLAIVYVTDYVPHQRLGVVTKTAVIKLARTSGEQGPIEIVCSFALTLKLVIRETETLCQSLVVAEVGLR